MDISFISASLVPNVSFNWPRQMAV